MLPAYGAILAAGISSASSLAGGFLSRPDHSERDLMHLQVDFDKKRAREMPRAQVAGLRAAGINPMLPFMRGDIPSAGATAVPARMVDPVGEAVGKSGASAVQSYMLAKQIEKIEAETEAAKEMPRRVRAETENIASQTRLNSAKVISEGEQPALLESTRELNSARTAVERQNLQRQIVETAIKQEELTIAEKDAIVAEIDIDMYSSTVGEVSRWLEKLGIEPRAAVGMAHAFWNMFRTKRRN